VGDLSLTLDPSGTEVQLAGKGDGIAWPELEHLLLSNGALRSAEGLVIPVLGFRRSAVEIADLLRRVDGEKHLDGGIQSLLRLHLGEIRLRQSAERGIEPLTPEAIRAELFADGRFRRILTAEQFRDVGRLLPLGHGANFSVPGAGKTTALLAIYEILHHRRHVDHLLVVAPKAAFLSWEDEACSCFESDRRPEIARLTGGAVGVRSALQGEPEVALITYQLLPNVVDVVKAWARRYRTHVVLDESHRVKGGREGVTAGAALQLSDVSARRDILSGTPLPQAPEDLRPQLDFLWPGHRIMPEMRVVAEAPEALLRDVEQRVRPLYARTTKNELQLPHLELVPVPVQLGPLQRELYELLRSEAARAARGMATQDRRYFRLLGRQVVRLLQAASNPLLLTQGEMVDRENLQLPPQGLKAMELLRDFARYEQPAKLQEAVVRAERAINSGQKVLIWTSFTLNLHALEKLLQAHGPVLLFGQVPTGDSDDEDTREGRIRRFHEDPDCRVMIANPAACGESISLHRACHYALYLDRTFNAAHFLQSVDRIHRLGVPPETVTRVEVLEARITVDQRVAQRLSAKIRAMAQILQDRGLAALAYDPDDVVEEFPGGLEPDDVEEVVEHLFAESEE